MIRSGAELDDEARDLLAQVDAEYAPSRADHERVRSRVLQALAGMPASTPAAGHEKLESAADVAREGLGGWSLGLGAKGIVGALAIGSACLGAGFFAGRQSAPALGQPPNQPHAIATGATAAPLTEPRTAPASAPMVASPEPEPAAVELSSERARRLKAGPAHVPSVAVEALPTSTSSGDAAADDLEVHTSPLWQETQLLQRAQRALGSGNAQLAQALLDELAKEFPNGVLIEERSAVRILTECALGRVAEARARAQRFEASYPSSVHATRVRASCAGAATPVETEGTSGAEPKHR